MSVRRIEVIECDHCRKVKPVTQWKIGHNGITKTLDLCMECAAPISRILGTAADGHDLYKPATPSQIAEARQRRQDIQG